MNKIKIQPISLSMSEFKLSKVNISKSDVNEFGADGFSKSKFYAFTVQSIWLVCLSAALLTGCGNDDANSDAKRVERNGTNGSNELNQTISASPQRPGDAKLGRVALTGESIVSCGLPLSVFDKLDVEAEYTLPNRSGRAAILPYNLNLIEDDNGVSIAASNCLTCHAAPLFGELVVGLGNEFLDFTVNPSVAVEQAGALVTGEFETAVWEKFADRIAAIAPYIQADTVGVNPANNLTFALMAHRDPVTMDWLDVPSLKPPPQHVPPVSVPPWWRMKKKNAMFSMGEGRGDHASFMMSAAILCTDSLAELQQLDAIGPDIRAYIESLEPPAYPFKIDNELASAGRQVFESNCSECHGTYGERPTYPNRLVDIAVVGTDSSLIDFMFSDGTVFVDWFNESPFGKLATAMPSRGYVAPPLDGVWATGPFLHNGSVPTIRAVLDSPSRPKLWHHRDRGGTSEKSYNKSDLGWHFLTPNNVGDDEVGDWLYDTRKAGYANHGHQFGDALHEQQRDAVIEYLKTL